MELYAFRHGPAMDRDPQRWPGDGDRPLSTRGARETRKAAKGFARCTGPVDRIASSPLARAQATAGLLAKAYGHKPKIEVWEELASGAPAAPILERLKASARRNQRVVVVGHEPALGAFVGLALTGETVPIGRLTKAGAVALSFPRSVGAGAAQIEWLATRKQLAALA
jgi:phosphohistidine phosphatase